MENRELIEMLVTIGVPLIIFFLFFAGKDEKKDQLLRFCYVWHFEINSEIAETGGERGIRTLDTITRITPQQGAAFDHSATSPEEL